MLTLRQLVLVNTDFDLLLQSFYLSLIKNLIH